MSELEKAIASVREEGPKKVQEWGSCEVTVGPSNVLAVHGIRKIDDVVIHVEHGVKFMDTSGDAKDDVALDGPLVYFHKSDHSMFGSKGGNSDDPDDWVDDDGSDPDDDDWGDDE